MEIKSKGLTEALEAAHAGARILRETISDMERALLSIDTLLAAAEKEADETKATVLAEEATRRSYREQERFVKAVLEAVHAADDCDDEEDDEE